MRKCISPLKLDSEFSVCLQCKMVIIEKLLPPPKKKERQAVITDLECGYLG